MADVIPLLTPADCALVLIDQQAGLAFGIGSTDQQTHLNNSIALARTAKAFQLPIVSSTSASKVYSGPLMPALQAVIPEVKSIGGPLMPALQAVIPEVKSIERRNMNVWEDERARTAILATDRKNLLVSGLLTEGCISFAVLSALANGLGVFVVADACGGLTHVGHDLALRRMEAAGAKVTSWVQVLLELQRDWTRRETYDAARAIVESNGGGYGIGLSFARDMIKPS
jgi:nicotinamidase-related amidase